MSPIVFEIKNRGTLGVPKSIAAIMVFAFGLPAIALPLMTWHELPDS
ncbi:MAG: hypothetical protein IT423_01830, partial [Pirellulaceae bacterium]|nr:hypothetical protein [Pirellulaceae bacterium]